MARRSAEGGAFARALVAVGRALQRLPRPLVALAIAAWLLLIWWLSSRPSPQVGPPGATTALVFNSLHAPEFGVLALLVILLLPRRDGWPVLSRAHVAVVVVACVGYAVADELHQALTPERDASLLDVLTDACGVVCVLGVVDALRGPRAGAGRLLRWWVWGLTACLVCSALATLAAQVLPGVAWL